MKITTVHFDISPQGLLCEGTLTLKGNTLIKTIDGAEEKFDIDSMCEAIQLTDIGCGKFELKPKNSADDGSENILVCRFSMTYVAEIGELVKVLNHYFESGEMLQMSGDDIKICPHCHRHYPKNINTCLFCTKKSYVFKRAFGYFKPYLKSVIFAGLLLTLSSGLNSIMPLFNSMLIDNYLVPTANATPYFSSRTTGVVAIALIMVAVFAVSKVFAIFSNRMSAKIGSGFARDLRSLTYSKIQELSLTSMSGKSAGNLIHRVTKDTERVKDFFNDQGRYLIEKAIMMVIVLGILIFTDPLLTVLVLIPVPLGVLAMSAFRNTTRVRYHKQWRIDSKATSILHDIIKGIRVVKSFGNEEREIEKFSNVSEKLADVSASNEKFWAISFPLVANFITIGEFLVLIVGGKMVLDGKLTLGELTRFNLYLGYLYTPMKWMSMFPRRVADCSTSLVKIYEVLDEEPPEIATNNNGTINPNGCIDFNGVTFGYKSYEPVLKNVNIHIEPGEMIGLVGHSGAGKSTIINLCMRLYDPNLGNITVDGVDIRTIPPKELRDAIGVVFQETYLFSGTIYDNIAYARPGASPEEIIAAAKAANAHGFITKLPDGYNTIIGENGHSLSGGERQRVSIARAILKNPKILILDEATSSLDPETEIQIQEALSNLTKGRTTIAIAHRLSTLKNANRLVVIEKGRVAEVGSHNELIAMNGIYAKLVSAQRQTSSLH